MSIQLIPQSWPIEKKPTIEIILIFRISNPYSELKIFENTENSWLDFKDSDIAYVEYLY